MKYPRRFMQRLTREQLLPFAEQLLDIPEAQLAKLSKDDLIDRLMEDDGEAFSEAWDMANEDYGDSWHPDESDDDFDAHEAPDKD